MAASFVEEQRLDAEVFVTERQGHARELAQVALRRGATRFVAWGGDGTVNEVASAIVHTDASLAIVPSGSGNGLARELGIPLDAERAFRVALEGRARVMDAGELDGHLFFNIAGFGVDARVAHRFATGGLVRRGVARYLELAAQEIFADEPVELCITTSGSTRRILPLVVAIANSRQYGSGAIIAPNARIDDGKLDLIVVDHRSSWMALMQAWRLFSGTLGQVPGVSMTQEIAVDLSSSVPLVYHVDGEPHVGGLSANVRVHPSALRVMTARR